ncbi:DHH family phosphoesterase [Metamycoplasma hominis]|uniref:DHH family phosphoesterase n=1 Tax=Metamycoplasma hominis TaxID=2098 RepID=UPI0005146FEA|nr:bifunctional oligoribonuclease/PAP phosphatase NrnA [Metamycoplasma hominis]KGF61343.1 PAP phosphatase [Metamycoplasma hominis]MBD3898879.1 bifunctional oligoribonuclease/PAP phosphatase NrnA [Metamycoplasma hominis]OKL23104.1 DHH family phosphoesterase [Metamycoplasma hominis]QKX39703.1 bifunctional oligoribonuclease/PAP phosphatase NrnA [Metamycoplasma hominis]RBI33471.1 bifunctional oligoribonuclease/PAP phosphatase NrnA [Metamycoplasma hominis]
MNKISAEKLAIFKKIEERIKAHKNIVIYHHIRPDGDCLGSQFGMKNLIKVNFPDKTVYTIGDSKGIYSFLEFKMDKLPLEKLDDSLAIIVDANFKERLECREYLDNNCFDEVIRIDHHPNDDDLDASLRWVEPEAPAAAQQVTEIAYELGWKLNKEAATYLYLGIYTDSVKLSTNTTTAKTMLLVSWLWDNGSQKDLIHTELSKRTLFDININTYISQNMKIANDVVSFYFPLSEQIKLGIKDPLKANRPFVLGSIDNTKAWVFFTEEKPGQIRCEFRSNGCNVRNVAIKWGGGGHIRASGAQISDPNLIPLIIKDLEQETKNLADYE